MNPGGGEGEEHAVPEVVEGVVVPVEPDRRRRSDACTVALSDLAKTK